MKWDRASIGDGRSQRRRGGCCHALNSSVPRNGIFRARVGVPDNAPGFLESARAVDELGSHSPSSSSSACVVGGVRSNWPSVQAGLSFQVDRSLVSLVVVG